MQGESDRQRELLDVESVAGHLLEQGSVFALLAQHRDRLFPGELFADLFPSGRGRPRSEERRVGKECVVRVDLGGRRIIKKKKVTRTHQQRTKINYEQYGR